MAQQFYMVWSSSAGIISEPTYSYDEAATWADKEAHNRPGQDIWVMTGISAHQRAVSVARTMIDITPQTAGNVHRLPGRDSA